MSEVRSGADDGATSSCCHQRRLVLKAAAVGTAALFSAELAAAASGDARKLPPQPGDLLAWPSSDFDDRLVTPAEIVAGAAPLLVYPRDPVSGVARERSRLNQILLLRLDPGALDAATGKLAVDGIVAYSGICTHAACGVSEWDAAAQRLICPCHSSAYDPHARAKVVNGPATRALPALPIAIADGRISVAGPFTGAVGAQTA